MVSVRKAGEPAGLVLGCMNFGKRTSAAESARIVARALERGITTFDTANAYNDGESERILGRALAGRREATRIWTKVGFGRIAGRPEGLARARVLGAIDESLSRLGTDHVDVYYLHVPDAAVPIAETLGAMAELQASGKFREMGVSNYASWEILEMSTIAGAPRPAVSQVLYNLLIRQLDIEYFKFTRRHPIHTTVFNPLAGGLLTGRHDRAGKSAAGSRFDKNKLYLGRYWSDRFFELVEAYRMLASDNGLSLVELSYAWLAGCPQVDSILVGPGTVEHLDAAIDAVAKVLAPEVRARVDAIHQAFLGTDASYVR